MKIIHSYWTKPYLSKENDNIGGWSSNLFHYMSCALSCLLAKKFYDIELVTDNKGVELFIDKIQLPYSSVKVVLNDLDEYDTELWALGKIYTYSIQEEPFLHIDNDLFMWDRFKTKILNANLVGQHLEIGYKHNELFFDDILTNLSYIPDVILQRNIIDRGVIEINAGVLGGKNMFFFKEYTKEAFCFVERNLNQISKLKHKGMFNTIFEQYLFYCMARELNETVEFLINDDVDDRFLGLADFWSVPYDLKYIHTVGFYKKFYMIGEQISQRLWFEYPEYYERIVQLYKKGLI